MNKFILFILQTLMLTQANRTKIFCDMEGSTLYKITNKKKLVKLLNEELRKEVEFSKILLSEEEARLAEDAAERVIDITITSKTLEVLVDSSTPLKDSSKDALKKIFRDKIMTETKKKKNLVAVKPEKKKLEAKRNKLLVNDKKEERKKNERVEVEEVKQEQNTGTGKMNEEQMKESKTKKVETKQSDKITKEQKKESVSHSKDEVSDEEDYEDEESESEKEEIIRKKTKKGWTDSKIRKKVEKLKGWSNKRKEMKPNLVLQRDQPLELEGVEKKELEENQQKLKRNDNQIPPTTGTENDEGEKQKLEDNEQKLKLNDNQILPNPTANQIPPIPTAKTTERKSIPIWGWVCIALSIVLFFISIAGICGYLDDCCCCGVQELNFDDDHTHVKEQYKDVSHQDLPRDLNIDVDHEEFGTLSSLFNDDDLQKAQDDICGIRSMQNELRSFDVEDSAQNDAEESCSIFHAQEPKPTSQLDDFLAQKMGKEKNEKSSLEIQENLNNIEQLA